MTFAVGGKQYVAILSGSAASRSALGFTSRAAGAAQPDDAVRVQPLTATGFDRGGNRIARCPGKASWLRAILPMATKYLCRYCSNILPIADPRRDTGIGRKFVVGCQQQRHSVSSPAFTRSLSMRLPDSGPAFAASFAVAATPHLSRVCMTAPTPEPVLSLLVAEQRPGTRVAARVTDQAVVASPSPFSSPKAAARHCSPPRHVDPPKAGIGLSYGPRDAITEARTRCREFSHVSVALRHDHRRGSPVPARAQRARWRLRLLCRQDPLAHRRLSAGRRLRHLCAGARAPLRPVHSRATPRWCPPTCPAPARCCRQLRLWQSTQRRDGAGMFASSAAMEPLLGNKAALVRSGKIQLDRLDVAGHRLLRGLADRRAPPPRSTRC